MKFTIHKMILCITQFSSRHNIFTKKRFNFGEQNVTLVACHEQVNSQNYYSQKFTSEPVSSDNERKF